MANIKEAMQYVYDNPTSDFANNFQKLASSGALDAEAKNYGIDLTPFKPAVETSSSATFPATGQEGILSGTAKSVGNIPSSAMKLGSNVVSAITHPIDTVKAVHGTVTGAIQSGVRATGVAEGLPITPQEEQFAQVKDFIMKRYGSEENFKKTLIEDPVGALADAASIFSGAGAGLKAVGATDIAGNLSKVASITEPISATSKLKTALGESTVGKVVSDISPTSYKAQQGQVVKALELTPGDLSTIQKSTGNDVTKFITDNNLIKATPEETANALNDLRQLKKQEVRGEVSKVKTIYTPDQIPNLQPGLNVILKGVDKVPGLEKTAEEIKNLANKETYTLNDVQRAKELIDENSNVYSKIGAVKEASTAKGLANIRGNLKTFIEDEVTKNTNGETNIAKLNNDVATSFAVEDAIKNRAMKGMSRQYISAYDLMIGGGAAYFHPLLGVGMVIAKKVAESPAFRLKMAKLLSKQPVEFVKKFSKEMANNNLSPETKATLQVIIDDAKKTLPFVESGSNVLQSQQ